VIEPNTDAGRNPGRPLKILAFVGSPRNEDSWTWQIMTRIEAQMQAIRSTRIEYVFLQKVGVPFCDGCLSCVNVGEHACPEFATIGPIAAKMDAADGLILGAPVHTFAVTGLMKNFVEYFMYKRNRPSFFGKKAVVTATASGGGHTQVLDFLEGTATAWGCDVVTRLGISSSQMNKPRYVERVDASVRDVAEIFIREINKGGLGSPKFGALMNFRAMQNMTRNQPGSINHEYWTEHGWFDTEYYTQVPINPWARMMAGYIARKMRRGIRKGNAKPYR
jgi:multimeric flavodoxin WrbA